MNKANFDEQDKEQYENDIRMNNLELRVEGLEFTIKELRRRIKILESKNETDGWGAK